MAVRAKVKQPFPYSRDGIRSRQMQVGEVEDFPEDVFAGLEASGQLQKTNEPLTARAPEPDWSALGDNDLVSMIRAYTGRAVNAGDMSHEALVGMAKQAFAAGVHVPGQGTRQPPQAGDGATIEDSAGKARSGGVRSSKA